MQGSVLVTKEGEGHTAYFAAGRTSHLDGGIRLHGVDILTGQSRCNATVSMTTEGDHTIKTRSLPDILSLQDDSLYMRDLRLNRRLGLNDAKQRHLYAPGGLLDDSWWHRTYWIYGTSMMSGYGGWPRVGNVTPAGRLLVDDGGDVLYGYGRMAYRAGAGHVSPNAAGDYKLFAEVRNPKKKSQPAEGKNKKRGPQGRREFKWSGKLPFVASAMVLSRNAILTAGGRDLPGATPAPGPGTLHIVSRAEGSKLAECVLPAPPVLDGMALTGSVILVSTVDGKVVCLR